MVSTEKTNFYRVLGGKIREARVKANLKQETFASFLDLSRASIVNIEKGRQHPPIHVLWDIAKVLNIQASDLFPQLDVSDKVSPQWKKIIAKESSDKKTKEKILNFIEEIEIKTS
ncbi:MAG: helix-turn-helix domain-containing protein [Bacteroidia bacterium]|jgi:DNA-binding XRE family transcriptional regulator|nr:helix-turn-helix domain-containing protein [Bacteroidia bacterium]